jgi:hypothetical protein
LIYCLKYIHHHIDTLIEMLTERIDAYCQNNAGPPPPYLLFDIVIHTGTAFCNPLIGSANSFDDIGSYIYPPYNASAASCLALPLSPHESSTNNDGL